MLQLIYVLRSAAAASLQVVCLECCGFHRTCVNPMVLSWQALLPFALQVSAKAQGNSKVSLICVPWWESPSHLHLPLLHPQEGRAGH